MNAVESLCGWSGKEGYPIIVRGHYSLIRTRGGIHGWSPGALTGLLENPEDCTSDDECISGCRRNVGGVLVEVISEDGDGAEYCAECIGDPISRSEGISCSTFA